MGRVEKCMSECILCPRMCRAHRMAQETGYCRETAELVVARAALHMWEEECISGENGSGAVWDVFTARIRIFPGQKLEKRLQLEGLQRYFWNCRHRGRIILIL